MENVIIHGFAPSTYTRSARMAAIEKGIAHELLPVAYGKPEHFALHPFGKLPAMTVGDRTVFETLAIMSELDDGSGDPTLFGKSPRQKSDVLTLVSVAVDYAYRPVVHVEVNEGVPEPDQLAAADKVIDWLEGYLGAQTFLAGGVLTAADLFIAPMLAYHAKQIGEDRAFEKRPRLRRWMGEMGKRASFRETA